MYILHPGYVTSKNDGDEHYVGPCQLMELYRVEPRECIVYADKGYHVSAPGDVHLYPRYDGNYSIDSALRNRSVAL